MFENIAKFFKKLGKKEPEELSSRDMAKERLQLVLMQDRANVSADFLDMMKQEIIEVIKKYIDVNDKDIDVRLTNKTNEDGTIGGPALYANIPISGIKQEVRGIKSNKDDNKEQEIKSDVIEEETTDIDTTLETEEKATDIDTTSEVKEKVTDTNVTLETENKDTETKAISGKKNQVHEKDETTKETEIEKENTKKNESKNVNAKDDSKESVKKNEKSKNSKAGKESKKETVSTAEKK